jgi:hypothetical protein
VYSVPQLGGPASSPSQRRIRPLAVVWRSLEKGRELAREAGTGPTGVDGVEAAWLHPLHGGHHQQALRLLLLHHAEPGKLKGEFHNFQMHYGLEQRHTPEIYRDYPRPPFLRVLRKEYFDCPQRDSHAVHYI